MYYFPDSKLLSEMSVLNLSQSTQKAQRKTEAPRLRTDKIRFTSRAERPKLRIDQFVSDAPRLRNERQHLSQSTQRAQRNVERPKLRTDQIA